MNREEKIRLIKDVANGNVEQLQKLKKEREEAEKNSTISIEVLTSAFNFIAKHGPVSIFYSGIFETWIQPHELNHMVEEAIKANERNAWDEMPDRALMNLGQCMDCLTYFRETGRMHLLGEEQEAAPEKSEDEIFVLNNPSIITVYIDEQNNPVAKLTTYDYYIPNVNKFFMYDEHRAFLLKYEKMYGPNHFISIEESRYEEFTGKKISWPINNQKRVPLIIG